MEVDDVFKFVLLHLPFGVTSRQEDVLKTVHNKDTNLQPILKDLVWRIVLLHTLVIYTQTTQPGHV